MPEHPDLCVGPVDWPHSFHRAIADRILNVSWRSYPGAIKPQTLHGVASWFGVAPEQVLVTRGASEALRLAFTAARADHRVLAIPAPSFIGFTTIAAAVDVARLTYPVDSMMGPNQDREAWRILARNPDVLPVICTPNNPTGHELDRDSLLWTVDQFHPRQAIVDLTYDPFSADALSRRAAVLADAGAVSLLSLSKAFCLAGVRLGVVIADAETIAALSRRVERFHLDVFQHAVLDELVEVDTMSRLTGVREATIRLRDAIARRVATTFPHLPVAAAVGNFVVCRPSQEFPCPCCAWVLDELECGYFRSINLVRLTASGHNLHRLDHVREDASGPADEFARQ